MKSLDLAKEYGFGNINTFGEGLSKLVGPAFSVAAASVVIYFLYGAIKLMVSGGDKNEVAGARAMITHAIIGFVLLMMMFLILQFVPQFLGLKGFKLFNY